jgi:hypothetical protein
MDNVVAPLPPPPQLLFDADDSTPPSLGNCFTYPVQEAIASLPTILAKDVVLIDLMKMLNDAGCPCYLFDEIVKFMECHSGMTFPAGKKIHKRETLMNHQVARFPVPEPTPVQVAVEHGSDEEDYSRPSGYSVSVQTWDFEKMCQSYLLDPFLFGNLNNLVNSQNPFEKYVLVGLSDKEVLASYWYSKTYDKYITDPETQFLLPLEMYLDKTGKTAGMMSYCGEPLIWVSVLLRYAIHQDNETWHIQGYIKDLEKTLSDGQEDADVGWKGKMGRTLRNYNKVLATVLQSIVKCQNKGRFDGYVRMGNEVRYMSIIPVFVFLKGDGKSSDAVVT